MREILFRGKRLDNGEWVYGYLRAFDDGSYHVTTKVERNVARHIDGKPFYILYGVEHEVDPETVGQLVRKGSEPRFDIYEGDILTDDWGYKYVIEWDNEDTVYRARDVITGELETLHDKWAIGAEFDNPEMLEVED